MIKELLASRGRKFILSVGDDGAVLVYMTHGKVEARFFFNNTNAPEIDKVFLCDTKARIFVLADVSDQSYLQYSLPPVSAMNVKKMTDRRLSKEFEPTDIKGALPLGRSTAGRKDWNFMFVSIRNVPPLSDWLEKISDLPNTVAGIYLLPVETESFVKALKKTVETENVAHASEWQMLVTHNKTGGLRQVVYRNGRILFTRMAQPVGGNAPGVIAGHIEQETLSTIEYIRRMNFDEKAGLDIFIITASDVKKQLESNKIKMAQTYVLAPHEVAGLLNLEKATEPRDKFADIVMMAQFGKAKKTLLRLTTPLLEKAQNLVLGRLAVIGFTGLFVPIAILLTLFNIYTSFVVSSQKSEQQVILTRIQEQQRSLQQKADAQAMRKAEVEGLVTLYEQFTRDSVVPFQFLNKLGEIKGAVALYDEIKFNVTHSGDPAAKKSEDTLVFGATVFYPNKTQDLQNYLNEVNAFAQKIRDTFKAFKIDFSGLPGQTDLNLSVEGGPTVIGATPKTTPSVPQTSTIHIMIGAKIDDEMQKTLFSLPKKEEEKKPAPPVPLQVMPPKSVGKKP